LPLSGPGGDGTGGGGVEAAPPSERTATRGGKGGVPALSGRTATRVGGGAQVSSGEDGRARWRRRGIGVFGATTCGGGGGTTHGPMRVLARRAGGLTRAAARRARGPVRAAAGSMRGRRPVVGGGRCATGRERK
jgi:hypothetical protein